MGESRVDRVRRVYSAWASGDFTVGWEWLADDAQFVPLDDLTDPDLTRGSEAIRGFLDDLLDSFSELTVEAQEFVEEGDRVLVRVVQRVVGRGSGASSEFEYWMQWVFDEDDRVVRFGALRADEA
jgi:ketosteroid isomerase-like protein